jgi:hypothetical protein
MQLALAAATFIAAVGATYFFCVRPMRQGRHCAISPPTDSNVSASDTTTGATAEALKAARAELDALREAIAAGDNGATVQNVASSAPRHTSDTGSSASGFLNGAG